MTGPAWCGPNRALLESAGPGWSRWCRALSMAARSCRRGERGAGATYTAPWRAGGRRPKTSRPGFAGARQRTQIARRSSHNVRVKIDSDGAEGRKHRTEATALHRTDMQTQIEAPAQLAQSRNCSRRQLAGAHRAMISKTCSPPSSRRRVDRRAQRDDPRRATTYAYIQFGRHCAARLMRQNASLRPQQYLQPSTCRWNRG